MSVIAFGIFTSILIGFYYYLVDSIHYKPKIRKKVFVIIGLHSLLMLSDLSSYVSGFSFISFLSIPLIFAVLFYLIFKYLNVNVVYCGLILFVFIWSDINQDIKIETTRFLDIDSSRTELITTNESGDLYNLAKKNVSKKDYNIYINTDLITPLETMNYYLINYFKKETKELWDVYSVENWEKVHIGSVIYTEIAINEVTNGFWKRAVGGLILTPTVPNYYYKNEGKKIRNIRNIKRKNKEG